MILNQRNLLTKFPQCCKITTSVFWKSLSTTQHAVVIGCYKDAENDINLTETGSAMQDCLTNNLKELLTLSNFKADVGQVRRFYNLHEKYPCITVAGLGDKDIVPDENEGIDQSKENIRIAIGSAVKSLRDDKFCNVLIDGCGAASAAAEGASLSAYQFDAFKSTKKGKINMSLLGEEINCAMSWEKGLIAGESQNFARALMETPSNYKYPLLFADKISKHFSKHSSIDVMIRDEKWAEEKKMNCFLSVGRGSTNQSAIVELRYNGAADTAPVILVGKGVTFDAGGISIKQSKGMGMMRGDMGGAAIMLATLDAVARMNLPINLVVLTPLAENMPSGSATKPGDVFTAMNGKTVEVDDTDFEGRLALADTLCYAAEFDPSYIINAATLTGEIDAALGAAATGTFTTCNALWAHLHEAGVSSGDRMWRMPVYKFYTKQMECSVTADIRNTQKNLGSAGACTAATFLKEFVQTKHWAHLDIAGVGGLLSNAELPYMDLGMSGRPTRTLIETMCRLSEEQKI